MTGIDWILLSLMVITFCTVLTIGGNSKARHKKVMSILRDLDLYKEKEQTHSTRIHRFNPKKHIKKNGEVIDLILKELDYKYISEKTTTTKPKLVKRNKILKDEE